MKITRKSPHSGKTNTFDLPIISEQIDAYTRGMIIDMCMPNLTSAQREFFVTGLTEEDTQAMLTVDGMTVGDVMKQAAHMHPVPSMRIGLESTLRCVVEELEGHGMTEGGFVELSERCWEAYNRLMIEAGDNEDVAAQFAGIEYGIFAS